MEFNIPHTPNTSRLTKTLLKLLPALLLAILISSSVKIIPAGQVGVAFSAFTGVKDRPLQEGIHFLVPFIDTVTTYDARLIAVTLAHDGKTANDGEGAINARSKEGLDITADVTVQFRIDRQKAAEIHKELGRNYLESVIRPQIRSKVRDAIGQFNAAELISSQRQEVEASITESLRKVFAENNIELESVLLRELRIPQSIAQAIESKQKAEQEVAVEKNRLQQANISSQRAVVEAQGKAKAAIETAKGEAEALSLRGRALRENPQLIQLTVAEKLAPTIQTVLLPNDGNVLLDMNSLSTPKRTAATTPDSAEPKGR